MIQPPGRSAGLGLFLVRESADELSTITTPPAAGMSWWRSSARHPPMFELMRALPLFKGFPNADLSNWPPTWPINTYRAGEVLFWQGEEGHECYVILAGEIEVIAHPGRSEVRLRCAKPARSSARWR